MDEASNQAFFEDLDHYHTLAVDPAARRMEQQVLGSDYGATSYTPRAQADELADLLELGPEHILLDIGTGSGWPGLYLTLRTGCRAVLTDVPAEGLRVAHRRAVADRIDSRCTFVVSSADRLPFENGTFDAVTHTDVLC